MWLWPPNVAFYHDVEPFPEPNTKSKCPSCGKTIRKNQAAILCGNCNIYFHESCVGLNKAETGTIRNNQVGWTCLTCSLPQFSHSFFDSLLNSTLLSDHRERDELNSDIFDDLHAYANKYCYWPKTVFTKGKCFKRFDVGAFNNDLELVPFNVAYIL